MATVFWDAQGVLLIDVLEPGQTINATRYCQTLDKLREAVSALKKTEPFDRRSHLATR